MPDVLIGVAQHLKFKSEDRFCYGTLENGTVYAGVFDGHNGAGAATWCALNMAKLLEMHYRKSASTILMVRNAFLDAHNAIKDDSGTTASLLVSRGKHMVLAHVGDSRVVLCHKGAAVTVTEDHHCDWAPERERITAAERNLGEPLMIGNRIGGLMLTRSIGDHALPDAIIPHPVIHEFLMTTDDDFLILATDGLWDACTGAEAVQIVSRLGASSATEMADALVHHAVQQYRSRQHRADDITCCVVHFKQPDSAQRPN